MKNGLFRIKEVIKISRIKGRVEISRIKKQITIMKIISVTRETRAI